MADGNVDILIDGDASGLTAACTEAEASVKKTTDTIGREVEGSTSRTAKAAETTTEATLRSVGTISTTVGTAMTAALTVPLMAFAAYAFSSAKDFESAFAGVKKTCDELYDANGNLIVSYDDLQQACRDMSEVKPISASDVASIMEYGGQLGVATQNLTSFADVISDMSVSTDLDIEQASTEMARFANITGMAKGTTEEANSAYMSYGATIVALGNNSAASESEISAMGMRIAAAGKQCGMSADQTLALAASLTSVGIEAEAGGTAISTVMSQVDKDVATNSDNLQIWADTAGMSVEGFVQAWKTDAAGALTSLFAGMEDAGESGENLNLILDEMGVTSLRQTDMMKRMSGASELLAGNIDLASQAWADQTALTDEASKRYATTESQMEILKNKATNIAAEFGGPLLQAVNDLIDDAEPFLEMLRDMAQRFSDADSNTQKFIIRTTLLVAGMGPALVIFGKMVASAVTLREEYKKLQLSQSTLANTSVKLIGVLGRLSLAFAVGSILKFVADLAIAKKEAEATEAFDATCDAMARFGASMAAVEPQFSDFSGFVSSAGNSMSDLQGVVADAQGNITSIIAAAMAERGTLNDADIEAINTHSARLAAAYDEQTTTLLGVLDGRAAAVSSKEGELTAEQAAQEVANIEEISSQTLESIDGAKNAQLQAIEQKYSAMDAIGSQAYSDEIAAVQAHYDEQVAAVTAGEQEAYAAIASKMPQTAQSIADFWSNTAQYAETGEKKHYGSLRNAISSMTQWTTSAHMAQADYKNVLSGMDTANTQAFLSMAATTIASGETLSGENRIVAQNILDSYDDLPSGMDDIAQQSLIAMCSGMEEQWPWVSEISNMTGDQIVAKMRESLGLDDGTAEGRGSEMIDDTASGISGNGSSVAAAMTVGGKTVAKLVEESMKSTGAGNELISGYKSRIFDSDGSIWSKAMALGALAIAAIRAGQKSGSPSRLAAIEGTNLVLGYRDDIASNAHLAVDAAKAMASDTVGALSATALASDISANAHLVSDATLRVSTRLADDWQQASYRWVPGMTPSPASYSSSSSSNSTVNNYYSVNGVQLAPGSEGAKAAASLVAIVTRDAEMR